MNWRWLLWDFADPALPMTWRQRMRATCRPIWIGSLPRGMRRGRLRFALSIFGVGMFALVLWIGFLRTSGRVPFVFFLIWMGLTWALIWVGGSIGYGIFCRREHYHRVRLDGYEVCTDCGYWLRGLDADVKRCPECGAAREPMPEKPA